MGKVVIHAIYDDEEVLMDNAKQLRTQGFSIKDVFSPFPIHGIDSVIGVPGTRLAICSFIYGITGLLLATWMMWYMMVKDWPTDIGGKPDFAYYMNVPAFIPVSFETTVFCAAHGLVITFLLRCWLIPGAKAKNPDPRTTDDKFMMVLETNENSKNEIESILKGGATELHYK